MSSETLRGIGRKGADGDASGGGSSGAGNDKEPAKATALSDKLGKITERRETNDEKTTPVATGLAKPPEGNPPPPLRSLDSTIPGTRSLDASVPGAAPSLDARLTRLTPPLSATLIGIPASKFAAIKAGTAAPAKAEPPKAGARAFGPAREPLAVGPPRRDHGTASGHDLHLPTELQRAEGVHAASGSGPADGTPLVILGPGLTGEVTNAVVPAPEPADHD